MFCVVWNSSFANRYQCFTPCATYTVRTAILKTEAEGYSKTMVYINHTRQGAQLDKLQQLHFRMQMRQNTWSDNKVRKLATMCLPWQHRTKALVWFHDVDISAFHSCVVVDLWQSLSE